MRAVKAQVCSGVVWCGVVRCGEVGACVLCACCMCQCLYPFAVYMLWLIYYVSAMPSPSPSTLCTFFPAVWDCFVAAVSHRCGCLPMTHLPFNNWHEPIGGR